MLLLTVGLLLVTWLTFGFYFRSALTFRWLTLLLRALTSTFEAQPPLQPLDTGALSPKPRSVTATAVAAHARRPVPTL